MAQNITLLGASYADVPAVTLPKTGGGTATFTDVSPTTAGAADVASGKQFFNALGVLTQGTASGGGGASNLVTGTFKGTTTDTAMEVSLNYSGTGYPVAVLIYPSEGAYNSSGTFYSTVQRYAVIDYAMMKCNNDTPVYVENSSVDESVAGTVLYNYKSSASNATSTTAYRNNKANIYRNFSASFSQDQIVRLMSNTKLSVYIRDASTTRYGFAANVEYKYWVIYSA